MATTYKLQLAAASDGSIYLDLPVSGRITSVTFTVNMVAGAGGVGQWNTELSRQAVNQITTNNPRGVIAQATLATAAASQGAHLQTTHFPNEPVKSGERLYLNGASSANFSTGVCSCFVTIG